MQCIGDGEALRLSLNDEGRLDLYAFYYLEYITISFDFVYLTIRGAGEKVVIEES
jgi:hypothetical protein